MLKAVVLTVNLLYLSSVISGQRCSRSLCQWESWENDWTSCSASNYVQRRSRAVCCRATSSFRTCLRECGLSHSDGVQYQCCDTSYICAHGHFVQSHANVSGCYGKCCSSGYCTAAGFGDLCSSYPCVNGGTCRNTITFSYACTCRYGYTGRNCESLVQNGCSIQPCSNGGTCYPDGVAGYTCYCPYGWSGPTCDVQNGCTIQPCSNGGTCYPDGVAGYSCYCHYGWTGPTCDESSDDSYDGLSAGGILKTVAIVLGIIVVALLLVMCVCLAVRSRSRIARTSNQRSGAHNRGFQMDGVWTTGRNRNRRGPSGITFPDPPEYGEFDAAAFFEGPPSYSELFPDADKATTSGTVNVQSTTRNDSGATSSSVTDRPIPSSSSTEATSSYTGSSTGSYANHSVTSTTEISSTHSDTSTQNANSITDMLRKTNTTVALDSNCEVMTSSLTPGTEEPLSANTEIAAANSEISNGQAIMSCINTETGAHPCVTCDTVLSSNQNDTVSSDCATGNATCDVSTT